MAEQYFFTLAQMPVCRCGMPLKEKGMIRRITGSKHGRAGPMVGREKSSITRCNIACHACGRDNVVEYLWINKWPPSNNKTPPQMGYQLMPGDDPGALMARLLAVRDTQVHQVMHRRAEPRPVEGPMTEAQADLARSWIARIRAMEAGHGEREGL